MQASYFGIARMRPRDYCIVLFLLSFLLRFGVASALRDTRTFHGPGPAGADAVEFNAIGLNLAAHGEYSIVPGHPTSFRAPGFPFFLAALYRVSYENYRLVYLALSLLGALTCLFTYAAGRSLLSEDMARFAGILAAVYLPHIYFSTVFLSEVLFAFCLALALWLFLLSLRRDSAVLLAAAGAALAAVALCRPVGLLFFPALLIALWRAPGMTLPRFVARTAILAVVAIAALAPWAARNYTVHGQVVLIASNGGSTFYGANNDIVLNDRAYLGSWISTVHLPGRALIESMPDEVSHDALEWKLGKEWVRGHLAQMPLLSLYKLARFWLPDISSGNRKFLLMQVVGYTPFALLTLFGLVAALRRADLSKNPGWLAVHGILAANLLNALIFYGTPRFRDSITTILILYAALALSVWLEPAGKRLPQR